MTADFVLISRCVKNEPDAWDEFLQKYSRLIYSSILRVLNKYNYPAPQTSADDIFQEIFYNLAKDKFKKLKSFKARNGCLLSSWLAQVTINAAVSFLRARKSSISLDEERGDELNLKDSLADFSPIASDRVISKEMLEQLKNCVAVLNNFDKYFLRMHIDRGIDLDDLRNLLNLSRGAVDMQKSRIVGRLRECFKKNGFVF